MFVAHYRWSSRRANAFGEPDALVSPHAAYRALSPDPVQRLRAYRSLVTEMVDPAEVDAIRRHLQRQHAYGSGRFRNAIEALLGRAVGPQKIGRPAKAK